LQERIFNLTINSDLRNICFR